MQRRIVVPGLFAAAASAVAYALLRLRRDRRAGPDGSAGGVAREHEQYHCACGQLFHVAGAGRHRVHWLPEASPGDPVLGGECPNCGAALPRESNAVTDAPAPY
jgi:hypothetical protein